MSEVVDVPGLHRFELRVDGGVAGYAEYRDEDGALAFTHTVVDPAHEGQGVGSALVRGALDDARERGLAVVPHCPFVRGWIGKHPEYADLVPADRRQALGLPPA